MNIAELSIRKSTITWVLTILLVVVGYQSFFGLAWLEDPEFTIKDAIIMTPYPGASAQEVEEEVTDVLEKTVQQLGQLKYIESRSSRGMSQIKVKMQDKYDKYALPQVWDELRRKVTDAQTSLPPGAGPSVVNDDFGDVYGIYIAITGEGYASKEIYEFTKLLQRELLHATDVKRIDLYGVQPEEIYVEMRRDKMSELGISQQDIYDALAAKNLPASAGSITLGREYIPVNPTGEFESEKEFGELLISPRVEGRDRLVYLRDVAEIKRGYLDSPDTIIRFDGKPAVGLGISTVLGGNVVSMGESLDEKLSELLPQAPLGMDVNIIAYQPAAVTTSINGFLVSLAQAVGIVIVVLLIFMGLRSGMIIGTILLVTIAGTFIFMDLMSVTLERISLGALVIALGMLVDNAIVVTDGMRVKMDQGVKAVTAARDVVGQTGVPLLGATVIAVLAFAAIGTSEDSTGEYCRTLFSVILISLMLSWVTAVTCTPLFCATFLKQGSAAAGGADPYGGAIYRYYRGLLTFAMRRRWLTIVVVVGLFLSSLFGFGFIKQMFFPESPRAQYYIDFYFPAGTHIRETERQMERAEQYLLAHESVEHTSTFIGGGQIRFLLIYTPESLYHSYAQILVTVDDFKNIPGLLNETLEELEGMFPEAVVNTRAFMLGPSEGGKIQLRIGGPDPEVLRELGMKAEAILLGDPVAKGVRNEWLNKVKVLRPQLAEAQARRAGVTRPMLCQAIEAAVEGTQAGIYREADELLSIVARAPDAERSDFSNLGAVQVWSPAAGRMIPAAQVVTDFATEFEDPYMWRRDRTLMLRLHADQRTGLPSQLLARVKPRIEQALGADVEQKEGHTVDPEQWDVATVGVKDNDRIPLKDMPGYYIAWGGEVEDSARAGAALAGYVPIFFGLMVLMVIFLFNSLKKTAIIWLTVPLSIIGVTAGLLLFDQPFGFMALLGVMSLAGMLIKNAIVLIDQIDLELSSGQEPFKAIVNSGLSRLIPVSMAALTTILGMIPLLGDAFFISMAVTIMFGLGFATVLTLVVVPVLYAIFFGVPSPTSAAAKAGIES
jgi:multidrug efflux pump subunit AcrB